MIAPSSLEKRDDRILVVTWNDGNRTEYDVRELRLNCPCATCVNEWTGKKTLDPAKVPQDVKPVRLFSVGRYAMGIQWSDGHSTGIFAYDYLRRLSQR
ncbi:MAG TPA: hypothetical protein DCQ83_01155 [Fibrobacteres bacterium]|nr:hypothetical protein [Fibrobacterota bacterium]